MRYVFCTMVVLAGGVVWPVVASAQVYKCTAANQAVAFQDQPCAPREHQQVLDVPSHAPPGYVPVPVATAAPPASTAVIPPPVVPAAPVAPLPVLYACVGAVNGKHYLTRSPPSPYLAPLGVMGYPPMSLSQAYGAEGASRESPQALAPRVRIGGPSIATGMTEVQDTCLPAAHAEVCGFVQREFDANARELRLAMRHEQPPLEQRDRQLRAQLENCR